MRVGIIPDQHHRVDLAQSIMDGEEGVDHWVCLGDYFDDFGDDVMDAAHTAKRVKSWLDDPHVTCLLGNHDISYGWGRFNPNLYCSGFARDKNEAIHSILDESDWKKFHLYHWLEHSGTRTLLTHAGYSAQYIPKSLEPIAHVDQMLRSAFTSLFDPMVRQRGAVTLLGAGYSRGGNQARGGVTWLDWSEFNIPNGFNQIVGHTPGAKPRKAVNDAGWTAVNLDTHLKHYGIWEDGELLVKEVG